MMPAMDIATDLDRLWDFGQPQLSEARFREALAGATGDRARVLRTQLARALGLQDRFDDAADELRAAEQPDETSTGLSPLVRCHLELERGRALRSSRGDQGQARAHFTTALDVATRAGIDHLAVDAAHMLAISLDGEQQIPMAQRALEIARSSSDQRARNWVASVTHNLGWTMHDLGRFDEALALWEQALVARRERAALSAEEAERQAEPIRVARWTVARGLRSVGRYAEAVAIQRALAAEGPPDPYVDEELAALAPHTP